MEVKIETIVEFVEELYVKFDCDSAQQELREREVVLSNEFLLVVCLQDFAENSTVMIFELKSA
jgi:hypothetical protein